MSSVEATAAAPPDIPFKGEERLFSNNFVASLILIFAREDGTYPDRSGNMSGTTADNRPIKILPPTKSCVS